MIAFLASFLLITAAAFALIMREARTLDLPGTAGPTTAADVRAGEPADLPAPKPPSAVDPLRPVRLALADRARKSLAGRGGGPYRETEVHHWARIAREDPAGRIQVAARRVAAQAMADYVRSPWQDSTDSFAAFCEVA